MLKQSVHTLTDSSSSSDNADLPPFVDINSESDSHRDSDTRSRFSISGIVLILIISKCHNYYFFFLLSGIITVWGTFCHFFSMWGSFAFLSLCPPPPYENFFESPSNCRDIKKIHVNTKQIHVNIYTLPINPDVIFYTKFKGRGAGDFIMICEHLIVHPLLCGFAV